MWIQPPFYCDYGTNISVGQKVFFNFNRVVLDVMQVEIGSNVLFGPAVQIYTATHPINAAERRKWLEFAKPVEIGSDSGGKGIRTPGLFIANEALYQLSYTPWTGRPLKAGRASSSSPRIFLFPRAARVCVCSCFNSAITP